MWPMPDRDKDSISYKIIGEREQFLWTYKGKFSYRKWTLQKEGIPGWENSMSDDVEVGR